MMIRPIFLIYYIKTIRTNLISVNIACTYSFNQTSSPITKTSLTLPYNLSNKNAARKPFQLHEYGTRSTDAFPLANQLAVNEKESERERERERERTEWRVEERKNFAGFRFRYCCCFQSRRQIPRAVVKPHERLTGWLSLRQAALSAFLLDFKLGAATVITQHPRFYTLTRRSWCERVKGGGVCERSKR